MDSATNESRGFGFVHFKSAADGQKCINHAQRAWLLLYATFGVAALALLALLHAAHPRVVPWR